MSGSMIIILGIAVIAISLIGVIVSAIAFGKAKKRTIARIYDRF